jgi:hypothetical protein
MVRKVRQKPAASAQVREHTVRAGDNLFKILMRDYGLTNAEAEARIDETLRLNKISNIKRLKIGMKILIPQIPPSKGGDPKKVQLMNTRASRDDVRPVSYQVFRLEAPFAGDADSETPARVAAMWNKLVPPSESAQRPLTFNSAAFSLTLDPVRYPVFSARNGARIVVDQHDTLPPLVKSLIAEKDSTVRIISGAPMNSRGFLSALLAAGGFYSIEDNFSLEFGVDPTLKVHSDFKIEKTAESLIRQDVILLNSNKYALPRSLASFLRKEGFTAYEPFAVSTPSPARMARGTLHQITATSRMDMVDAILNALSVTSIADRRVDVFAADNNGISLSVKAERYFERDGKSYIIAGVDGDYILFRILESKGHRVIFLDPNDDFRTVSEKILDSLQITGNYARHMMVPDSGSNYSLQMTGFRLEGPEVPGGAMFMTNKPLDPIIRDLLSEYGYDVQVK